MLRQNSPGRLFVLALTLSVLALLVSVSPSEAPAAKRSTGHVSISRMIAPVDVCPTQPATRKKHRARAKRAMACMTNYARRQVGLRKLRPMRRLNHSARMKARDILRCDQFSHNACGRSVLYWFKRVGYVGRVCRYISENIAWGGGPLGNTRNIFTALMHSRGHREAILSRQYTVVGNGVVRGNMRGHRGAGVWAQHFGGGC
ncbi:MAG: CAP domain-containing protein [Solirubrobacterales bacterium]|nr:CAP domain-containing protein [Solirubrobacterales bacterium]